MVLAKKLRELWAEEGRARLETPGRIELFTHKTLYSYIPEAKRVTVKPQERNPFFDASDLSIGTMVRSVLLSGHPERIQSLDDIELDGRLVKRVAINMDMGNTTTGERTVLYAESQSDLPIRCDNQRLTHNGWLTEETIEVHYNDALASDLFKPNYPKDVQMIDVAAEQKRWLQMSGREIGRVQTGDGTVIIHDLQVSAEGDVFLLTSGGGFGGADVMYITHKDGTRTAITRPSPLELTDDQGTRYLPQFNFGGQPNVQRWTPLTPTPRPWQARRFTIKFRSGKFFTDPAHPKATASWTLVVSRPEAAVMPDYLPNVNPGLYWNETRILADDSVSRAEALRASGKPEDLERALSEYQNVISTEDEGAREHGSTAVHPEAWFGIYGVLRDLGRTDQAREALQQAQDQDIYHNMTKEIAEAWQQIGRSR